MPPAAARVALFDLRLPGVYDYLVPEALVARLAVGQLVVVPLGPQTRTGVVTELTATAGKATKPLASILYDEALLPPPLLKLGEWIAAYYRAPLGLVFQTMLPPGVAARGRLTVAWTGPAPDGDDDRQTKLHQALAAGPVDRATLKRTLGPWVHDLLRQLAKKQLVTLTEDVRGPRTRPVAEETITAADPAAPGLTRREAQIAAALAAEGPCTRAEAIVIHHTTYDLLGRLEEKGALTVEKIERLRQRLFYDGYLEPKTITLTGEQETALGAITGALRQSAFATFLLHGVTGSGKTEIYLRAIAAVRAAGGRALYLVPEIALTPQVVSLIGHRFAGDVAVLHSGLSDGERFDQWRRISRGEVGVVVGARSAVFAPLPDLKLIVVDEEGETAFKQAEAPHYHARDVAIVRAHHAGAVAVLGSASPSLESFTLARRGKYRLLTLTERATGVRLPTVTIVDMRAEYERRRGFGAISEPLRDGITKALAEQRQVILFLNRRGYRSIVLCPHCGDVTRCDHCSIALTYHRGGQGLLCHYCGLVKRPIQKCAKCGKQVEYHGTGTQRLEEEIGTLFPDARLRRMDRDVVTTTAALEEIFARMQSGEIDILLGTQMVAKGLDFPRVGLVGVINADLALHLPDFRAAERTFIHLLQVAGRSGRAETPGEVIIQTFDPGHPALIFAATHDYEGFYRHELAQRKAAGYPPERRLALLTFAGKDEAAVKAAAARRAKHLKRFKSPCLVKGPAPAPVSRVREKYRYQLLLTAPQHRDLQALLDAVPDTLPTGVALSVDIDPVSTM